MNDVSKKRLKYLSYEKMIILVLAIHKCGLKKRTKLLVKLDKTLVKIGSSSNLMNDAINLLKFGLSLTWLNSEWYVNLLGNIIEFGSFEFVFTGNNEHSKINAKDIWLNKSHPFCVN